MPPHPQVDAPHEWSLRSPSTRSQPPVRPALPAATICFGKKTAAAVNNSGAALPIRVAGEPDPGSSSKNLSNSRNDTRKAHTPPGTCSQGNHAVGIYATQPREAWGQTHPRERENSRHRKRAIPLKICAAIPLVSRFLSSTKLDKTWNFFYRDFDSPHILPDETPVARAGLLEE